jgi:hypothetical protein
LDAADREWEYGAGRGRGKVVDVARTGAKVRSLNIDASSSKTSDHASETIFSTQPGFVGLEQAFRDQHRPVQSKAFTLFRVFGQSKCRGQSLGEGRDARPQVRSQRRVDARQDHE